MGIFKRGRPSRQDPPSGPGLYRFVDKLTGRLDYIGETSNLRRRISEHFRSDKQVSPETHHAEWQAADGRSTSRTRRQQETLKISQFKPGMNKRRGGAGRRSTR